MASEMILQNNTTIYNEGQPVRVIGVIESGSVLMKNKYFSLTLVEGQVMGLLHLHSGLAFTTDTTNEDTTISAYRLESTFPDKNILQNDYKLQKAALETLKCQMDNLIKIYVQYKEQLKTISLLDNSLVKKYAGLCEKLHVTPRITNTQTDTEVMDLLNQSPYIVSYYMDLKNVLEQYSDTFLQEHKAFVYGLILKASEDASSFKASIEKIAKAIIKFQTIFFNEDYNDYFRYFSELLSKTHAGTQDYEEAKTLLTSLFGGLYQMPFIDKNALQIRMEDQKKKMQAPVTENPDKEAAQTVPIQNILMDSMNKILSAANEEDEFVSNFTKQIYAYKDLNDKSSNAPAVSQLRHKLTDSFLHLYTNLALKYVCGEETSDIVKLFLTFGYIDEDLAGMNNAESLYKLLKADISDENEHIYTFIDWLKAIYDGKKEPSRNEFDMDYTDFLRSEKAAGKITAQEEKDMLENSKAKVEYELKNFFPPANKMTFGHISTYCPFFSSHNLIDHLEKGLLSATKLVQERENIRKIDYQIFFKEVVYTNPSIGINAEFIHTEIAPDIILMPNYGARGIMWQEVEGKKRATPCRMVLPVFTPENLRMLYLRLCGEYRWEMCKRTQGSHWNDPNSNSLTGDYFDYLQFYRKNNDLSPDAKEKVKTLLTKARNSIKEAFVLDYIIWVAYESEGSPRLNKVARSILFNHCPFPAETRHKLTSNPIYLSVIQRHASKYEQLSHRMSNLCQKITNSGKELPDELRQEIVFFDK
ncbi:MAG: hypothetical protein IJ274_08870 [Lachnospiraceae bacterium]|nr:hypothetical protein [Lachnospiraceae bacterium]